MILTVTIPPSLSFEHLLERRTDCPVLLGHAAKIGRGYPSHVAKRGELIEISADGSLLTKHFVKPVDDDYSLAEAAGRDVLGQRHSRLLRFPVDRVPVVLADSETDFSFLVRVIIILSKSGCGLPTANRAYKTRVFGS